MKTDEVKKLAEILSLHNLTRLEVSDDEGKIILEKRIQSTGFSQPSTLPVTRGTDIPGISSEDSDAFNFNNLKDVKSPLVGVFYSAPSPDSPPFVSIGSNVKKGDVLCVIETMKLLNEIAAEQDGEIVDICVKNGDIAEFGQILFKMV